MQARRKIKRRETWGNIFETKETKMSHNMAEESSDVVQKKRAKPKEDDGTL